MAESSGREAVAVRVDRRMMYFDNHKLKRNFQDSL
jgi:hypothetical protein